MMKSDNKEKALAILKENRSFLLICHDNPDGDTLGSALGLFFALKKLGKQVRIACGDPVPALYRSLPGWEEIALSATAHPAEEQVVYIDCADPSLIKKSAHLMREGSLCLDHHRTNPGFAAVTFCRPEASAAGEVILELIHDLDIALDHAIAKCLFYAISTDTGHFSFSNTSADAFFAAGELMRFDLDVSTYCRELYRVHTVGKTRLVGRTISNMRFVGDGKGVYSVVSLDDLQQCGAKGFETDGLIDYLRDIAGVVLCALLKELPDGTVKVSLRSSGKVDCSEAAARYGGGGHAGAAGFSLAMGPAEAAAEVERVLVALL